MALPSRPLRGLTGPRWGTRCPQSPTRPADLFPPLPPLAACSKFFESVEDSFELQRGLNNCFAYDLVPGTPIVEAALKAARRLNDYPTAVRIFEGVKEKVENQSQYKAYLDEFADLRKELGPCNASVRPFSE